MRHGMSTRQIARHRGVSTDAVKFHVAGALDELGLSSREQPRHWPGIPADSALSPGGARAHATATATATEPQTKEPTPMTDSLSLGPIGQIARHVRDVPAAERWYRDVLGLPHLYTFGDLTFFDCGGTRLFLSSGEDAASSAAQEPSVLYFTVPDIHAAHAELTARGITFRGAPHLIHRHASGVEEWLAFFEDLDGHLLALMSQTRPRS